MEFIADQYDSMLSILTIVFGFDVVFNVTWM